MYTYMYRIDYTYDRDTKEGETKLVPCQTNASEVRTHTHKHTNTKLSLRNPGDFLSHTLTT